MTKSLMISIQPKHLVNILNGYKTLELRKNVPKDYKGWVYVYCTKGVGKTKYHHLYNLTSYNNGKTLFSITHHNKYSLVPDGFLNGKVVARFWFDEYNKYVDVSNCGMTSCGLECDYDFKYWLYNLDDELKKLCLTYDEVENYGKGKDLYTWHIKKLEIFDKPMELSDFYKATLYATGQVIKEYEKRTNDFKSYRLQRPPQSWQYIYVKRRKENE